MSLFDNLPDFEDDQIPTAEEFNAWKLALQQAFGGNIGTSNITWPLVADGQLDMNNNAIINAGSTNNVIHVNNALSLADAVAQVNSGGVGGHIIIDPDVVAETTAAGVTITANNVRISGGGTKSEIECTDGPTYGITVQGWNCTIDNLKITASGGASAPDAAVYIDGVADFCTIRNCYFRGTDADTAIQIGANGALSSYHSIANNFFVAWGVGVDLVNAHYFAISDNIFVQSSADMVHVRMSAVTSDYCRSGTISGNIMFSDRPGGAASIQSTSGGVGTYLIEHTISGNVIYNSTGNAIDVRDYKQVTVSGNMINGDVVLFNDQSSVSGNVFRGSAHSVQISSCDDVSISGNMFESQLVCTSANRVSVGGNTLKLNFNVSPSGPSVFVGNTLTGNLAGLASALASNPDIVYGNNHVTGTVT